MQKRWNILTADEAEVTLLHDALKINKTLCSILVKRNIKTFDEAKAYFRPQLNSLHSPWLMKDMKIAVERIEKAFNSNEKILVYGDYDVDGTTSVASMYHFIKSIYPNVSFYIPHRYKEGYGISKQGIDYASSENFSLIISLDCGIKSVELINEAAKKGIDFIVCDHHLPDNILPDAVAILNPKQIDCSYPYKELCGCGVGFKLIQALCETLLLPGETAFNYLDLVATAIAADIVPISGENRILAFFGLKKVNENPNTGIKALLELSSLKNAQLLHINNLVFVIAPRVNAAGRMDDAKKAVQLFIEEDYAKAIELAGKLHDDNSERKEADISITSEALALIKNDPSLIKRKSTVLYQDHWHKGVIGIVASRLIETYYRPTIVLTKSGDIVAGSARSVAGFNLYEAIHACKDHLLGYGGHFAAAGMTLLEENVTAFSNKFEEVVKNSVTNELLTPIIDIDAEITLDEINQSFYNIICQMEPFGPENMRPIFIARHVIETGFSKIVKGEHIKFFVNQGRQTLSGIGFNLAHKFTLLQLKKPIDIVFSIDLNDWNNVKTLQLRVLDFKLSGV
jgi:single-stranded-DNA-specific exonuclease